MIAEHLLKGAENAQTGRELARILNIDIRDVVRHIEKERRDGAPICAGAMGSHKGYYLAADQEELIEYCGRLHLSGACRQLWWCAHAFGGTIRDRRE